MSVTINFKTYNFEALLDSQRALQLARAGRAAVVQKLLITAEILSSSHHFVGDDDLIAALQVLLQENDQRVEVNVGKAQEAPQKGVEAVTLGAHPSAYDVWVEGGVHGPVFIRFWRA